MLLHAAFVGDEGLGSVLEPVSTRCTPEGRQTLKECVWYEEGNEEHGKKGKHPSLSAIFVRPAISILRITAGSEGGGSAGLKPNQNTILLLYCATNEVGNPPDQPPN